MASGVIQWPVPPQFEREEGDEYERFATGCKRFEVYVTASNFTDEKQKRAIFWHVVGSYIHNLVEILTHTGDITYVYDCNRYINLLLQTDL